MPGPERPKNGRTGHVRNEPLEGDDDGQGPTRRTGLELSSVQFAQMARAIALAVGGEARIRFRSPPRVLGLNRSIRHHTDGSSVVSVALRGRIGHTVAADMIEGAMAAWKHQNSEVTPVAGAGGPFDRMWQAAYDSVLDRLIDDVQGRP